jgi:hypothetical protein
LKISEIKSLRLFLSLSPFSRQGEAKRFRRKLPRFGLWF